MQYGGFWLRFVAYIIDAIVMVAVQYVILMVLGLDEALTGGFSEETATLSAGQSLTANVISIVLGWLYFAVLESGSWQATLGKKALGMVVTDVDGQRISFLRATGRYFGKIVSSIILLIGFIMIAFTERKQGLHDMMAGTLVVKGQPGTVGVDSGVFE